MRKVNVAAADELGWLHQEIGRLKAREAELHARFAATPGTHSGSEWEVTSRTQMRRSFDSSCLPREIREDPAYWRQTPTVVLAARRRATAGRADDIMLIEAR